MTKIKTISFYVLLFVIFFGCEKDKMDIYDRPEWLAGKVYTQISDRADLSTFAEAIEITGMDEIINVSGSYTVFAPSNEAFNAYFSSNTRYNSIQDMPVSELARLVEYHIVQNPWSKIQLRTLDVYGWIDTLDVNNDEPRGYKRETLLLDDNRKYGFRTEKIRNEINYVIVDTLETNKTRMVATDSRKYAPLFYQEYFDIYDLDAYDYEFYFNRPFEGDTNIYYGNSKIVSKEIFAENGFVYIVDQVVEPLDNAAQMLEDKEDQYDYSSFLELVNRFPDFEYNEAKTFDQPGAEQGLKVDSLFDLTYPDLAFDINNEQTSPPTGTFGLPSNVTIRYHHGLTAPTNAALQAFENEFFAIPRGWGRIDGAPREIQRIIVNTNMSVNPIYPTDVEKGYYNGELDIVTLNEGDIIQKEYGSNSTFIGMNKAIVPRAFSSVTGPIYLNQGFSKIRIAIEQSGLLPALKRPGKNYSFYVESDGNTSLDSSLLYNPSTENFSVFITTQGGGQEFALNQSDLRTLLLNHVATAEPRGLSRKEFITNLAGNFLVYDNETGVVSGTGPTTVGYNGTEPAPEIPFAIFDGDNGTTYEIDNWFSFATPTMFSKITVDYPKFHSLLRKAGLSRDKEFRYSFTSDTEFYTVFIPSDEALDSAGVNQMPVEELKQFLMFHFVQGEMVLTDGIKPTGYYETLRVDEKSTEFSTVYTQIYLDPGYDVINILGEDGSNYEQIVENGETTNILIGVNIGEGQSVYPNVYNNGAIHEITKALTVQDVDTN